MTSTIKVTAHNDPVRVRLYDYDPSSVEAGGPMFKRFVSEEIIKVEDGEATFHCWKGREVSITDIEPEAVQSASED